jgi:hypothetical protein
MPDSLEYVVRPFTTPNAHGQIIIPATPRGSRERATLTWGATSAITIPEPVEVEGDAEGVNFEVVCCKEQLNELDRESDQERVFQNGDVGSSNWVDVLRPRSVRLKKKEKNSCLGTSLIETSDVTQQVNDVLGMYESAFNSGTTKKPSNCSVSWGFKN